MRVAGAAETVLRDRERDDRESYTRAAHSRVAVHRHSPGHARQFKPRQSAGPSFRARTANTLAAIGDRGAGFRSLGDPWADPTTPHGKLMISVLGGLAEFERHLILSRTSEGRQRAKANGVKFDRKPKLTKHQIREIMGRLETGETCRSIAKSYNVSHMTISRLQLTWSVQRLAITHKKQQPSQGNECSGCSFINFSMIGTAWLPVNSSGKQTCILLFSSLAETPA
jgi:hypothetical protein